MQSKQEKPVRLSTKWGRLVAEQKDKSQVLCEYPRPSMERENWQC